MGRKVEVKKRWGIVVLLIVFSWLGGFLIEGKVYADVNDFYFDDFTADYYLSRAEDGTSRLHVKEVLTAVFPKYEQNKGICRRIPFTNQDGRNVTLPGLTRGNIKVTRNGMYEPIYSLERTGSYYKVCTGTEDYVLGRQVYTFEYEFEMVVTDFGSYQELYWDTNGNGWMQNFNKLTARIHFDEDVIDDFTGESWCYVGKYGEKGQERCKIEEIDDGVSFTTNNLQASENLTFDVKIKAGSFVMVAPLKETYVLFYTAAWSLALWSILVLAAIMSKFYKVARGKKKFYKSLFVKPEYQPDPDYSILEMADVYVTELGEEKGDAKVAAILDLIVKKKISLVKMKDGKKNKWKIKVLNLDGVGELERILLTALNGGDELKVGDEIILMRWHGIKGKVLGKRYREGLEKTLKNDGLMEKDSSFKKVSTIVNVVYVVAFIIAFFVQYYLLTKYDVSNGYYMVGNRNGFLFIATVGSPLVSYIVSALVIGNNGRYEMRTKKGLEVSRYMDGLKMYMKMVEADRLKFLQSVEGADITNEGVVHLYEKLLPYAVIFNLESSWVKELEKYYGMDDVVKPEWYMNGITTEDLFEASSDASMYLYSASSSFSSSGLSGSDGGGSSGGGGGGGGGGGR